MEAKALLSGLILWTPATFSVTGKSPIPDRRTTMFPILRTTSSPGTPHHPNIPSRSFPSSNSTTVKPNSFIRSARRTEWATRPYPPKLI
ncbi:hypothetical protein F4809DRAFT_628430 [Biscogniauxia mediterranea]|nr:hypothetical protein F4809DRAFT_628430 [Biscogniauxia mediterranea]